MANELQLKQPRLPYHSAVEEKFGVDKSGWKALVEAVFPAAQEAESVILALSYCKARGLDPFKKCVHIVPIWDSKRKCMVDTVWPGIGELRTTAFRTKNYAGRDATVFGPETEKTWKTDKGDITVKFPEWAQVTVYRLVGGQRVAFAGPHVYWTEIFASAKGGAPNSMWQKRPRGQLDKCFDENTEVLTDKGFQLFKNVTGNILQVTSKGLKKSKAKPFSRAYAGDMIQVDGNALNFSVTPNHDMLTSIGKIEASKVYDYCTCVKGHVIPATLETSQSNKDAKYTDRQIVLAAAIVCDGWRHGSGWGIGVSRPYKIKVLNDISLHRSSYIQKSKGDVSTTGSRNITTKSDKTVFYYAFKEACGLVSPNPKSLNNQAIMSMSRRQARLLVDSMVVFDGATTKTARRFYSSSSSILGSFELAAVIGGYSISPRKPRRSDIGGVNWSITVSTKEELKPFKMSPSQTRLKGNIVKRKNEPGVVWCCRVPSGIIVVRRKGLSMLCGNCAEASALRGAFPEEIGDEYTSDDGPMIYQHGYEGIQQTFSEKAETAQAEIDETMGSKTIEESPPDNEPQESVVEFEQQEEDQQEEDPDWLL